MVEAAAVEQHHDLGNWREEEEVRHQNPYLAHQVVGAEAVADRQRHLEAFQRHPEVAWASSSQTWQG